MREPPCCPDGGWACDTIDAHVPHRLRVSVRGRGGQSPAGASAAHPAPAKRARPAPGTQVVAERRRAARARVRTRRRRPATWKAAEPAGPGVVCANGGVCDGQGECGTCAGYQFSCATAPCCAGYTCDVAALTCLETPGSACAAGDLCANGDTCPVGGGTCAPHATCVAYGEACTGSACCPGLLCDATAHECLVAPGAGCNYLLTCADGYTCDQISQLCDQTE